MILHPYVNKLPKNTRDLMQMHFYVGYSDSSWIKSDDFYGFLSKSFFPWLHNKNVQKPVILFVDGHKTHVTIHPSKFCEDNEVILYLLPPNTSHILQPADVGAFWPLKHYWKEVVANFQREEVNAPITRIEVAPLSDIALKRVLPRASEPVDYIPWTLTPSATAGAWSSKTLTMMSKKIFSQVHFRTVTRGLQFFFGQAAYLGIRRGYVKLEGPEARKLFSNIHARALVSER